MARLGYTLAALAAAVLALATSGVAEKGPPSCICTSQYDPVCGADGKTYGNACEANCARVTINNGGPCAPSSEPSVEPSLPKPCACTRIYRPVCSGGETYSNNCVAECDGVDIDCDGECPCPGSPTCICTRQYDPVCGADGKTYGNNCEAECDGVDIDCDSECPCPGSPKPTPTPRPERPPTPTRTPRPTRPRPRPPPPTLKPTQPTITCANILCSPCFYCKNAQCLPSESGTNCDLNSQPSICDGEGTCVAKPTKPTCATIRCARCFYCENGQCLRSMRGYCGLRG